VAKDDDGEMDGEEVVDDDRDDGGVDEADVDEGAGDRRPPT